MALASGPDSSFGQAAIALGYVTAAQVEECVRIQEMIRLVGLEEALGDLLTKKGYLSPQGHTDVLQKLGLQKSPIPGYTILSKIGQGAIGVVYKAIQTSVNRTVAIKILNPRTEVDETYVARFLAEAQAAANLNHKNLISAIDVGVSNGIYYFVMEFVTGRDCRAIVDAQKGPLPESMVLHIGQQMAEVLDHIHQNQMVHRDIKPENILLTGTGMVKLCDLGLAKSTLPVEQSLTQEGRAVGTPYFMSPEQIRSEKDIDIRADLYSLGATLYFLLTAKPPFEGRSAAETMSMHLKEAVPDPRKANPEVSEDLAWVVQKLLAKDRAGRYQTPAELLEDLRRILSGSPAGLARSHQGRLQLQEKSRVLRRIEAPRRTPLWPFALVGGGMVAALSALFALGSPSQPVPPVRERVVIKEVERPAARAAAPKDDDPRQRAAAFGLYTSAEELVKEEKWTEALLKLQQLEKDYGSLQFVREHAEAVGKLSASCEVHLAKIQSDTAKLAEEAHSAMAEGRWADAAGRLEQLVKAGQARWEADLDRARRELQAQAAEKEIEAARDAGQWVDVDLKVNLLLRQHRERPLSSVESQLSLLVPLAAKAKEEGNTARIIANLHAAVEAGDWKQVRDLLVQLERHRDSDTYRTKEGDVQALRTRYADANAAAADEEATHAWASAQKAYADFLLEKRYDEASDALEDFRQKHGASRVGKSKDGEVGSRIAEAQKKKQSDRNDEARRLLPLAKKEIQTNNYETALEYVNRLMGELADTEYVKANLAQVKGYKKICDERARPPANILVEMGFEDYPGLWQLQRGATGGNTTEEPYQGRRSARFALPPGSRVTHPLGTLPANADTVTFWARVRGKSSAPLLTFFLNETSGMTTTSYFQELTLSQDWRQYVLRIASFKPAPSSFQTAVIAPARISSFALQPTGTPAQGMELQFDLLRIESPGASK